MPRTYKLSLGQYAEYHALYPRDEDGVVHTCRLDLRGYIDLHERIRKTAIAHGCKPFWHDGLLGWAWHCGCADETHFMDQQCSAISTTSARRKAA